MSQIGGELGLSEGATTWNNSNGDPVPTIVTLTSQLLVPVATAGVLACGYVQDKWQSQSTTRTPPYAINGNKHWPFAVKGARFLMNVAALSSNAPVTGASAQVNAAAQVGVSYGIARATTGAYAGYQFVDVTNTTQLFCVVVEIPLSIDGETNALGTYNGLVVVEILPTIIQNL
jgi:hypothetical protein